MTLSETLRDLAVEKPTNFIGETGDVHPMYEALSALLKTQLTDETARKRLLMGKKDDLKAILLADYVVGSVSSAAQKNEIRKLLESGQSIDAIAERAAVYLAETKRSNEGDILQTLSGLSRADQRNFRNNIKAIATTFPGRIYLKKEVIDHLRQNKIKFQAYLALKYVGFAAAIAGAGTAAYMFLK